MIPLVEVPPFVHQYTQHYQDLFSPEQFEHFKRYLSGLFVSDNKTIQGINGLFVVQVRNQSSLNRFLTEYAWSSTAINARRLQLLRQDPATCPKKHAVLIIDDTHNEKYGQHFPLLGKWFIPSADRYGLSHNVVTIHDADRRVDYPLELRWHAQMDIEQTVRGMEEHRSTYRPAGLARKKRTARSGNIWATSSSECGGSTQTGRFPIRVSWIWPVS